MKLGHGKNKGSAFERDICSQLSLWVTHGKRKDCFWRSAMSGGRATVRQDVRQCGDITAVAPEGHKFLDPWFIECKHVKSLELSQFLTKNAGVLWRFWEQACNQAINHKKDPMLIAKQNVMPTIVVTKGSHLAHIVQPRFQYFHHLTRTIDFTLFADFVEAPCPY